MSIQQKTIKGIYWSAIQNWGYQASSLLIFFILARLLTPSDFGLTALANLFISFTQIFLDQGFGLILIQKQDLEKKEINTLFWTQILIGVGLTCIIFLFSSFIANKFHQPQLKSVLKVLSFLFIIGSLGKTQIALLKRNLNFKVMAIRLLISTMIGGVFGIIMAILGCGVWSLVGQQMSYEIIQVFLLWNLSPWRPQFQFSRQCLSNLYSFSLNILGIQFLNFFNRRTDNLLIGYFFGEVALGYYTIAQKILQAMDHLLTNTLNQVLFSSFSRLQDNKKQLLSFFYRVTQNISLFVFPIFFTTIILSNELIMTLFGKQWSQSISIMQIISFSALLHSISGVGGNIFIATGKPFLHFKITLFNTILNILLCCLAVKWGILAVATAYVVSDYLVFPYGQWLLHKFISFSWKTYFYQYLPSITCTLIMSITIFLIRTQMMSFVNNIYLLGICFLAGIVIYILALKLIFSQLFTNLLSSILSKGESL